MSPSVVSATDGGTTRYGKQASELQEGIQVTGTSIKGKLKLVSEYAGFGGTEATQPDHYLALDFTIPEGSNVSTIVEGGDNKKYVDLTSDKYCVYRIKDQNTQKIKVKTVKGGKEVEQTYDLTGLTLADS